MPRHGFGPESNHLADQGSNPKPPTGGKSPSETIIESLGTKQFQLMVLPLVQPCPIMDKLNASLELQYLYADGRPVPKASFVLETANDSPVMSGPLGSDGRRVLTVPKGFSYQFYLQHDAAPDGTLFQFDVPYRKDPGPFVDTPTWNALLLANGKVEKLRMHWGLPGFDKKPEDQAHPWVEYFLLHAASKSAPVAAVDSAADLHVETARILLAMLLGGYGDVGLWRRLILNRAAFALGPKSRVIQELASLTSPLQGIPAFVLSTFLNSTGKGNAIDWLRGMALGLVDEGNLVAAHIGKLFKAVGDQLRNLEATDAAGDFNQKMATRLLQGLSQFPAPGPKVEALFGYVAQVTSAAVQAHPAMRIRTAARLDAVNVFRQVAFPLAPYTPRPVPLSLTWFEARYLYSEYGEKKPITDAKLLVQDAESHAQVVEVAVDEDGIGYVEVPTGKDYEFRFHDDKPVWKLDPPKRTGALDPAETDWVDRLIDSGVLAAGQKTLLWEPVGEIADFGAFKDDPSFTKILRLSLIGKGIPRREGETAARDKAGEKACTALLRALLYSEKSLEEDRAGWWREGCLNRLRSVLDPDGAFCEWLVGLLNDRADVTLDELFQWMNSNGKGNVKSWLKDFQGKTADYRSKAAAGLQDALDFFALELKKIAEPAENVKDKVSGPNSLAAKRIRERIAKLPKAADATSTAFYKADATLKSVLEAKSAVPLQAATMQSMNEVVQKNTKPSDRSGPELPDLGWIELLYLYADGTPVKKAKYTLDGPLDGDLDDFGFGFEIVAKDFAGRYSFKDDPNEFQLKEERKLKAKAGDVGVGMIDAAKNQGKFKASAALLRWGADYYTSDESFKNAPSLSQILNVVVRNFTLHVPSDSDHQEITLFLFPLIMAQLLTDLDAKAVWKHASFHRLGSCLGENGAVIRDLLYWLSETVDPKVADAIERLNSVGHGHAYQYLGKLHGEMDNYVKAVVDNLTAILDDFKSKLGDLISADVNDVAAAVKRFLKDVVKRIDKVKLDVASKVEEALQKARQNLDAVRQQVEPVREGVGVPLSLNIYQQKQTILDPRPTAVPPEVFWLELEYQHHDSAFVEEAEYVLTNEAGDTIKLSGTLDDGFVHLVAPKDLKFKYYFRRDKAYALDPLKKGKAIGTLPLQQINRLIRNAILLKKFKKTKLTWGSCLLPDKAAFYSSPSVGAIATNVIRGALISPHMLDGGEAAEMATLLHPLLMREAAKSVAPLAYAGNDELWLHAVLNRMSTVLGEDGPAVAAFLWAVHQGTVYVGMGAIDAGASIKKPAALEFLNALGRGNAIRWLETFDPLKNGNRDTVSNNITAIMDQLDAEMTVLKLRPSGSSGTLTERRLQSKATEIYADVVKARILAVKPTVANEVNTVFVKLRAELQAVLSQAHEKKDGVLNQLNLIKQALNPPPPRAPTIPRWIELQYCYTNGIQPVPSAEYELRDGGGVAHTAALDPANGFAYVTDVPATVTDFSFKRDNTVYAPRANVADIPMRKKPEGRTKHRIPEAGYVSEALAPPGGAAWATNDTNHNLYNVIYGRFYGMGPPPFGWPDNTPGTAIPTLATFKNYPSIRALATKAIMRFTSRCCNYKVTGPINNQALTADPDPERIETIELLKPIVYSGNAALAGVFSGMAVWSALVMNRVGTTNHGGCIANESRLRKALLLEAGRTGPALTNLIEMLNSTGKGHTVRWLRALYANRNDVKTGVVNSITGIVTDLRAECIAGINFNWVGNGDLGANVRPHFIATRANCDGLLGGGNIQNKVDAVLDPVFVALGNLVANDPLNPRPYVQAATLNQYNFFAQPSKQFPLAAPQLSTPPFWNLAAANTIIQVKYENSAGGNVTSHYNVSNAAVVQIANTNGSRNFTIPNGAATSGVFFFDHDQGPALVFKNECKPFSNPELPAALGANFLDDAAVHTAMPLVVSCFNGKIDLPWEGTEVITPVTFKSNPTLGQIVAKCVIDRMILVSGAGDVQELTVALTRLIRAASTRTDPDAWFRAAVAYAGSLADHGSVIKGILLRVRKRGEMDPEEFFKLINFAGDNHGNAIDWLKTQIINAVDIGGAAAGLKNILSDLDGQLGKFAAYADPPASVQLKNVIAGVKAEVLLVHGMVDANVPACFTAKAIPALNRMMLKLPIKRPACLGLNLYKREVADMFLESQQSLAPGQKQHVDQTVKQMLDSANSTADPAFANLAHPANVLGGPYGTLFKVGLNQNAKPGTARTLHAYLSGTRGGEAKRLAPQLATKSNTEFVEFVENLPLAPPAPGWTKTESAWGTGDGKMGTMTSYEHTDGTLIRYKPHGDEYQRPPAPMYSIEVLDTSPPHKAMFKVDPNGNAVPWGPGNANNGGFGGQQGQRFMDNVSKAGHRPLRY